MTPELQSQITNAELTLIPLAVTALGLWLRSKISELQAKSKVNSERLDLHDNKSGLPSAEIIACRLESETGVMRPPTDSQPPAPPEPAFPQTTAPKV